jgi:hypothetical protein
MWPFTRMMATRTLPKTLSASRRQRRPGLECLEEKNLLSTVFGSYPDGTWAWNDQAGWRHLNTSIPLAMKEGADGTLFVSYNGGSTPGPGTFRYDYGSNTWTELTGLTTNTLSASRDNTFFAGFYGYGTYEFDGSWHQLASHVALQLAAVSHGDVYAVFGGDKTGTWQDVGNRWNQIDENTPIAMDASSDGDLYASFYFGNGWEDGTWRWDPNQNGIFGGGWEHETTNIASQIVALSNTEFIITLTSVGTVEYRSDTGGGNVVSNTIANEAAGNMGHSGSTVIMSFNSGTWTYSDSNGWLQIDWDHAYQFA